MIPDYIKREHILAAMKKIDAEGVPDVYQSIKFDLLFSGKRYPPKYVVSLSHLFAKGKKWSREKFSGGDETNKFLAGKGFKVVYKKFNANHAVSEELEYRKRMWATLLERAGTNTTEPRLLRELGIYGGAQGVWVDKTRTSKLTEDGIGVTVGLLHTGSSYADDISDDAVLYHYPNTKRAATRDKLEIHATKAARTLSLPVFIIKYPSPNSTLREVYLGWVEDWDDHSGMFLITLGETPPQLSRGIDEDEQPFKSFAEGEESKRLVKVRKGQQRFKFDVLKRYGPNCAICDISYVELLDGAHIIPKKAAGSHDARNGLVLCALHHRAFDSGLFCIEPNTLKVHLASSVTDASSLRITHLTLEHLLKKPHNQALEWRWHRWERDNLL